MAKPIDERELEIRKKVGAILFAIAGMLVVVTIIIWIAFADELNGGATTNTPNAPISTQIQYEQVGLQDMLDELNTNALRAEAKYQDKHIEITGKIKLFDSDGKYIAIVPCGASDWSFDTVQCYLTDPTHKAFLLEKNVGDVVTIKGKVSSIGEVLGYSVKIAEIS